MYIRMQLHKIIKILFLILGCFSLASAASQNFAIVDVTVIPMNRERTLEHQTVLIKNDIISDIGSTSKLTIPPSFQRIDGKGRFLIPGLTDAHVHLFSSTELPLYLVNGVTTVFNLNGRPPYLLWRKWIQKGKMSGPTIYSAGPAFTTKHTPEEAVKMVDEQAAAGYDAVKIYNEVGREEYGPLIAEAKKKNLLLMGHVAREPGFEATLEAGQSIAHAEEFTYTFFNPAHDDSFSHIVFDESKIPTAAKMTAAAGIYVIPTISTFRDIIRQATDLKQYLGNPEFKYLAPWILETLQPGFNRYDNRYSPEDLKQLQLSLPFQRKLIHALEKEGVPLMCGTDSTNIGPIAGFSIHEELSELVSSGLTPYQALQTATTSPAKYLRRSNDYGTIEKGKHADLALLRANPLLDIRNTKQIDGVMVHGQWLGVEALKKTLEAIPPSYVIQIKTEKELLKSDPKQAGNYLDEQDPWGLIGGTAIADLATDQKPEGFRSFLHSLHDKIPDSALVSEETMNGVGYTLLTKKHPELALVAFEINTENFPKSPNAFDSLAEAYAKTGSTGHALEYYAKALKLNANYPNAEFARKFIEQNKK